MILKFLVPQTQGFLGRVIWEPFGAHLGWIWGGPLFCMGSVEYLPACHGIFGFPCNLLPNSLVSSGISLCSEDFRPRSEIPWGRLPICSVDLPPDPSQPPYHFSSPHFPLILRCRSLGLPHCQALLRRNLELSPGSLVTCLLPFPNRTSNPQTGHALPTEGRKGTVGPIASDGCWGPLHR